MLQRHPADTRQRCHAGWNAYMHAACMLPNVACCIHAHCNAWWCSRAVHCRQQSCDCYTTWFAHAAALEKLSWQCHALSAFSQREGKPSTCFVEFVDPVHSAQALQALQGTMLPSSEGIGIRLEFSKNPLGVKSSGQPTAMASAIPRRQ